MNPSVRLAVVIVNYKTGHLMEGNLRALEAARSDVGTLKAFIVDNQSPDDSAAVIDATIRRNGWQAWATLVESDRNGGFSYGNNVGVAAARRDPDFDPTHIFFLNPDAVVQDGAIARLCQVSAAMQDRALLGAQLVNETGERRMSAFRFPSMASEFQRGAHLGIVHRLVRGADIGLLTHGPTIEADWVTGAAFFAPVSLIDAVGPMDDGYFLYFEEIDYQRSIRAAGFPIHSVGDALVMHLAGQSTGVVAGKSTRGRMPDYWYESWHRYFFKQYGALYATGCAVAWVAGRWVGALAALVARHRQVDHSHRTLRFLKLGLLGHRATAQPKTS